MLPSRSCCCSLHDGTGWWRRSRYNLSKHLSASVFPASYRLSGIARFQPKKARGAEQNRMETRSVAKWKKRCKKWETLKIPHKDEYHVSTSTSAAFHLFTFSHFRSQSSLASPSSWSSSSYLVLISCQSRRLRLFISPLLPLGMHLLSLCRVFLAFSQVEVENMNRIE